MCARTGQVESSVVAPSAWACGGYFVTTGGGIVLPPSLDTARSSFGNPAATAPRARPTASFPTAGD
eukprot:5407294-Pyramimonas_sp.AAC.1